MSTSFLRLPRRSKWAILLLAIGLLLLVGFSVIVGARNFIDNARWVSHTHATIEKITELYSRVRDVESAQRGYLLTGHVDYLAQLNISARDIDRLGRDLTEHVIDNTDQEDRAQQMALLSRKRIAISNEVVLLYQNEGFERARTEVAGNRGKDVMDRIAAVASEMQDVERGLLAQRNVAADASAADLQWAAVLGISFSLALIGTVFALMLRENRVRLQAEREAAAANAKLAGTVDELNLAGHRLHELQRGASMLQSCRSIDEAMDVARQSFSLLFPGLGGAVYLTRASQNLSELRVQWGQSPCQPGAVMAPNDCWAVRRGQAYEVSDSRRERVCSHVSVIDKDTAFSTLCVPLVARGETLGVVHLCGAPEEAIAQGELVSTAVEQLSLALSNLQLQESLRIQSIRDPLTGLYNRRYLEESLERELGRCRRRGQPLSVLVLDIDHFKRFNDTHGHDGGDALLAQFGRLVDSMCRTEDIACRFGGEEFVLILPEAGVEIARDRAEGIRVAVSEMQVTHMRQSLGPVTCSIGVAAFPLHAEVGATLVQIADAALYRAKAEGRDRVVVA